MESVVNYSREIEENVSRETFLQLEKFKQLLLKWNKAHNLTSRTTISEAHIDELIADSLILDGLLKKGQRVLDIGSGGGFPGLVLAMLGHNIDLVERNFKKTVFLNEAKRHLHLATCRVVNVDIRDLAINDRGAYEVICSKAMASAGKILDLSVKQRDQQTKYLLLKSKAQLAEIEEARQFYHFNLQLLENKYRTESVVLILSDIKNA